MNVLFLLTTGHEAIEFYRSWGILKNLKRLFHETTGETLEANVKPLTTRANDHVTTMDLFNADVVFMDRPHTENQLKFLIKAKVEFKCKVWVDYDDDLFNLDRGNPAFEYYTANSSIQETIASCLNVADAVSVTTSSIQTIYSSYNRNVFVIPNAYNNEFFDIAKPASAEKDGSKSVAWRGSNAHLMDIYEAKKGINELVSDPKVKFMFFGWCPPFVKGKFGYARKVSLFAHFKQFRSFKPQFLIVPLSDTLFNQGKSNISFIEATSAGSCVIAPYCLPEFVRPGIINYDDPDGIPRIIKAVKDKERVELVQRAQRYILQDLSISNINVKRVNLLLDLTN